MNDKIEKTYSSFSQMKEDLKDRILMVILSHVHIKVTQQAIKEVFRVHKGVTIEANVYDHIIFIHTLKL